jgi:hypothetical protein
MGEYFRGAREPYSARMLRERPRAFNEPDGVCRAGLPTLHACDTALLRPFHATEKLILFFLPPFDSRPGLHPDCALQRRMRGGMRSGECRRRWPWSDLGEVRGEVMRMGTVIEDRDLSPSHSVADSSSTPHDPDGRL